MAKQNETLGRLLKLTKFKPLKIRQNPNRSHEIQLQPSFVSGFLVVSCREGTYLVRKMKNQMSTLYISWSEMTEEDGISPGKMWIFHGNG